MYRCNPDLCDGCGACAAVCPVNGIVVHEDHAEVVECVGCGRCTVVCPTGAMSDGGQGNPVAANGHHGGGGG